ncbi:hypothetical protein OG423_21140 [Micromonospora zamorensis]|nr:hypothetical protein OG423_21140 [Micromonospora zamorensis]
MDVNSMWACLHDHDTANHWKQVAGWRKVCDLAQIHLGRLQEYRRGLAEAWPPETSAASNTYLAELDQLIDKVRRTHDAAAANYTALSAATQAIGTTRAALSKIYEEYAAKLQQKQAYDSMAADPKAVMGNRVTEAPVTDGELERLNSQARAMMFSLSGELQQAQATLQKPPPPPLRPRRDPSDPDVYSATAPIIPPILPMPMPARAAPQPPSPTVATGPLPTQATPITGPILGGTSAGVVPPPASLGAPGAGVPISPTSIGLSPPLPPGPIIRSSAPPPSEGSGANSRTIGGIRDGVPHTPPPTRAMPPGGLIGGAPGIGLGQPASPTNSTRRVNPIGGVIGGGGAGTTPTGGAGSRPGGGRGLPGGQHLPPIGGAPGSGGASNLGPSYPPGHPMRHRQEQDEHRHAWDPDQPWETEKGVEPVVRPPEEQSPPDPGPAIGFNR